MGSYGKLWEDMDVDGGPWELMGASRELMGQKTHTEAPIVLLPQVQVEVQVEVQVGT